MINKQPQKNAKTASFLLHFRPLSPKIARLSKRFFQTYLKVNADVAQLVEQLIRNQ